MSRSERLLTYAAMAAAPSIVGGAAHAGATYYQYTTPVSVTASRIGQNAAQVGLPGSGLSAVGININLFAYDAFGVGQAAGILVSGGNGPGFWRYGTSNARTISYSAAVDFSATSARFVNPSNAGSYLRQLDTGRHYIGLTALSSLTNTEFTAWFEYELVLSSTTVELTIHSYAYDLYGAPLMMPGTGGSMGGGMGGGGAVPGLGGLAALACGAAGMRRNRQRVA